MDDNYKSGQVFIAYKGDEFKLDDIRNALNKICPNSYTVNFEYINNAIFAKIVFGEYSSDREPLLDDDVRLSVSGYNQNQISEVNSLNEYGYGDSDKYYCIINDIYRDFGVSVFAVLKNYMNFCSVIYDEKTDSLIAGVTEPNSKYTHLHYGYTKKNEELMFSNNKDILTNFCDDIKEMKNNTYMKNKEIYNLLGEKFDESLDDKGKIALDALAGSLNGLLLQAAEEAIEKKLDQIINSGLSSIKIKKQTREFISKELGNEVSIHISKSIEEYLSSDDSKKKIEDFILEKINSKTKKQITKNVNEYLTSDDPKKRIEEFILNELDNETKKQILLMIKEFVEEKNIEKVINDKLEQIFNDKIKEYATNNSLPIIHIIKLNDIIQGQTKEGFYHEKFEEILSLVQLDEPVMLIGPAGSGKNYAIGQIADALGLHMYYTNNASNEFKLTGFIDAGGNYRDTEFYKAFKNGGVFFLDEIDNSDPSSLIVINSALANGYMAFPHETIERHPNFRMVAAANTWGKGSDLQYVGRNALDGATLDRFDNVFFDYDKNLEKALYPSNQVLNFMWAFRDAVELSKIPHIISTRGIGKVYKKEINGIPVETILRVNVVRNLSQDDLNIIIGNMKDLGLESDNKYYETVKTLKLVKKNNSESEVDDEISDEYLPF